MFNPLLQAIELFIIGAMRALYEAVILRLPFPGMEMGEGRGSLQLELMEVVVISLHTPGLETPVLCSPVGLEGDGFLEGSAMAIQMREDIL